MDVARKSWQPVWVPTALLFRGMDTMEKPRDEGMPATKTRGFLVVESAGAGTAHLTSVSDFCHA
jgi:hypothetical protein